MEYFSLIDLEHYAWKDLFQNLQYPWQALELISNYIAKQAKKQINIKIIGDAYIGENVRIGENTIVQHGAMIKGPALIGSNCEIRKGAYIRQNVVIGDNCVIGNSSQLKNSIILNNAKIPHFNYVGDSILGNSINLGAGVILSNLRLDRKIIKIQQLNTKLQKFGAIIGDHSEIGCNSVLNPGSIIGSHCVLYPNVQWKGVLQSNSIVKVDQTHTITLKNK